MVPTSWQDEALARQGAGIHGVVAGEWLDPASEPAKAKRGVLLDSDGAVIWFS